MAVIDEKGRERGIVGRDVDEPQPIRHASSHADGCGRRAAVECEGLALSVHQHTIETDERDVIGRGIVRLSGLEHDERAV